MTTFTLGVSTLIPAGDQPVKSIDEWDYSCQRIEKEETDGAGLRREAFPCFNHKQGCASPENEADALRRVQSYYKARTAKLDGNPLVISITSHFFYQHYAAELGAQLVASEVGENVNSTQAHIAFNRGAARQYNKPWGMDMSSWYGPSIRDYNPEKTWGEYSSPTGGHSLSLTKRTYFTSYMAGATFFMDEAGSINFFKGENLSPLGGVAQDFNRFTADHPDRGTPYVPTAILMDHAHGMGLGWWESPPLNWDTFSIEDDRSRMFTKSLFEAIWPQSFLVQGGDESHYLVASPFGDSFDVLLENTPTTLFSSYSVIIATGHLANNPTLISALKEFVEAGGILVLDPTSYGQPFISGAVGSATATKIPGTTADQYSIGSGSVVVITDMREWTPVLSSITSQVLPFKVYGSAEFMFNKKDTHWIVTLVNNEGVTKLPMSEETIQAQATKNITVQANSGKISNIIPWRGSAAIQNYSNSLLATVGPGDVAIYEFEVGPPKPVVHSSQPTLFSTSSQGNAKAVKPLTGTLACSPGYMPANALVFNATNSITGTWDQFYLTQCWNASSGGMYSASNQHNVNVANPVTGTLSCPTSYQPQLALLFSAVNPSTGTMDQFYLWQCWNSTSGGLYSTSNIGNDNKVNPVTHTLGCGQGFQSFPVLTFNAFNPSTGAPDQFSLHQCLKN